MRTNPPVIPIAPYYDRALLYIPLSKQFSGTIHSETEQAIHTVAAGTRSILHHVSINLTTTVTSPSGRALARIEVRSLAGVITTIIKAEVDPVVLYATTDIEAYIGITLVPGDAVKFITSMTAPIGFVKYEMAVQINGYTA